MLTADSSDFKFLEGGIQANQPDGLNNLCMSYELILCAVHTALCLDWPFPIWFRLDLKPMCCDIIKTFVGFGMK